MAEQVFERGRGGGRPLGRGHGQGAQRRHPVVDGAGRLGDRAGPGGPGDLRGDRRRLRPGAGPAPAGPGAGDRRAGGGGLRAPGAGPDLATPEPLAALHGLLRDRAAERRGPGGRPRAGQRRARHPSRPGAVVGRLHHGGRERAARVEGVAGAPVGLPGRGAGPAAGGAPGPGERAAVGYTGAVTALALAAAGRLDEAEAAERAVEGDERSTYLDRLWAGLAARRRCRPTGSARGRRGPVLRALCPGGRDRRPRGPGPGPARLGHGARGSSAIPTRRPAWRSRPPASRASASTPAVGRSSSATPSEPNPPSRPSASEPRRPGRSWCRRSGPSARSRNAPPLPPWVGALWAVTQNIPVLIPAVRIVVCGMCLAARSGPVINSSGAHPVRASIGGTFRVVAQ